MKIIVVRVMKKLLERVRFQASLWAFVPLEFKELTLDWKAFGSLRSCALIRLVRWQLSVVLCILAQ